MQTKLGWEEPELSQRYCSSRFRNPNAVGTFAYHCHLLEHEDGDMMGTIQVLPKSTDTTK
ncbi:multicopper oxidase domain-containing protein [Alloacidobacterium dinghuense]|nr:multicopper oxidase domain-containing protein [Alloacidobacterium dinghuense]